MDATAATPRVPRADARRSRTSLLAVATELFADHDEPTLKEIANRAGVGIGTLFRHFPTREALVEAVYENELAALCASVDGLLAAHPPELAMRAWMSLWSDFVQTKRGMGTALQHLAASGAVTKTETGTRLTTAVQSLLDAGKDDNSIREDVRADDITAALTGILLATGAGREGQRTSRLLDLLMDGLTVS